MAIQAYAKSIPLVLVLALFAALAFAAGEVEVALKSGPDGKNARGGLIIRDRPFISRGEIEKEISVHMTGLQPDSVHTVWLVNERPRTEMQGLGNAEHSFISDNKGNGTYVASISLAELAKWSFLEVARHPGGDPKNTATMKIVFKADIR